MVCHLGARANHNLDLRLESSAIESWFNSMNEFSLIKTLQKYLEEQHWTTDDLLGASVFCRNIIVTPYFFCSDIRTERRDGSVFRIEGAVGVIHREFEREWCRAQRAAQKNTKVLPTVLLINNLVQLGTDTFISRDNYATDLEMFSKSISGILETLPNSEEALIEAYTRQELCGKPLSWFKPINMIGAEKFDGFIEFIRQLEIKSLSL
jgi:hypothetical protein